LFVNTWIRKPGPAAVNLHQENSKESGDRKKEIKKTLVDKNK